MHPHHVHISYASPRVKSRGASSQEKKEDVREKDNDQHRTARAGYSEPKKQDVREKNNDQHRTARAGYSEPNAPKNPDAPVKDASRDSLSQELFASSSSSSSSFSISTATEVAAMASYISMSVVVTIASWLPTVLEVARLAYIAQRNSWDSLWLNELPARATPEFQFKE